MSSERPARQGPPQTALFSGAARPQREERPPGPRPQPSESALSSISKKSQSDDSSPHRAYLDSIPYDPQSSTSYLRPTVPGPRGGPKVQFTARGAHDANGEVDPSSAQARLLAGDVPIVGYSNSPNDFKRKRSLVRPDRERVDENHRLYNYRQHAAAMEAEGRGTAAVSRTGHYASAGLPIGPAELSGAAPPFNAAASARLGGTNPSGATVRRGKSILAREEGMANETGLSIFKRGGTLRRPTMNRASSSQVTVHVGGGDKLRRKRKQKQPISAWMMFCLVVTACCPSPILKCIGYRTKDRQDAFREKIGLLCIIGLSMAFVGFLTFGFTQAVCGTPGLRYHAGTIEGGSMIYHGYDYDFDKFRHPAANGISEGSNPLYDLFNAASMDGSFLFQKVNQKCLNIITPAAGTGITHNGNQMGWYFPCNLYNQYGTSARNLTGYAEGALCHTQTDARKQFAALKPLGQVYYTWDDLKNSSRNLGVYDGAVLDFSLLNWLDKSQVSYPALFDTIRSGNDAFTARDITALMLNSKQRGVAECMVDVLRVGFIDSKSFGCVASDVVLYVSLVVIIGVVVIRFFMAVMFGWFLSWKIGKFPEETFEERRARAAVIEDWTEDIYRPAPARFRPNVPKTSKLQKQSKKSAILPTTSRFSKADLLASSSDFGAPPSRKGMLGAGMRNSPPDSPGGPRASRSSTSLPMSSFTLDGLARDSASEGAMGVCPFPLGDVVPQPSSDYQPFNFPLAHTIMLVTAYSESVEGLRTTLDSLSTTDYPNSHKLILVIADGMVKGSGNDLTTPEIVLGMMKELVTPPEEVEALSYVAIADGHKRHNMAKVYAGFYEYDNNTVELSKQQRVPMMLVAKVGNPAEVNDAKPGNRGKRDSQIVLMTFLQKVMFDERMTTFEYEFFNSMWRCTGVSPDRYETVLCVDADTKIFPDSVSRMMSCMVNDTEIMGLCGETKIANKSDTWVTMIQVFEYYVSHHLTKAFESMFGGVTCLPGCFSMYRIKAPKGGDGYWVPVLANPDIVMHYSENVVDTLHKKNLLLLGEDRYLTTLMLRTFPRRKMMFCPQAVCKTIVPDTFGVLLSQRRRWINSTVHNLFELIVVPDLCGVFCFSMRFVIFMELAGTLVLPAAIAFTGYLIIIAIIPGTVKPTVSLILLALILGIPAVLIVVTSRRFAYLGWMLIYLCSLPIWNFVLPAYAFLHMDDFSWGATRQVAGEVKGADAHGAKEGTFDSSHITMKRWADWERERRYRNGTQSRDSGAYEAHRASRYSLNSSETYISGALGSETVLHRGSPSHSESNGSLGNPPRYPVALEMPAPLASQSQIVSPASSSASLEPAHVVDGVVKPYDESAYPRDTREGYDTDGENERLFASPPIGSDGSFSPDQDPTAGLSPRGRESFASNNPFAGAAPRRSSRGVSLRDDGPAPGARVVQRNSQGHRSRASNSFSPSEVPSPVSTSTAAFGGVGGSLPPGAAPPRHSMSGQR
ncbi:chitin synthase CHS3 [Sporobolomyces koalae]|uniref:chitin synthase CHS3 n=1 Tax=Sporobolomyces koalae TaxID=500713 RepID=UPI0031823ABB